MNAAPVLLAVALSAAGVADEPVPPEWCTSVRAMLAQPLDVSAPADVAARVDELTKAFPKAASHLLGQARALISFDGRPDLALEAFATAAAACTPVTTTDAAAVKARLAAIVAADPRLASARTDENMFARWRTKLFAWLQNLLESAGMQRYAGGARFVYLALVVVGASVLAFRLMRRRRLQHPQKPDAEARAHVTVTSAIDAAGWERDAAVALTAGDLRRAAACIDAALRDRFMSSASTSRGSTTRELVTAAAPDARARALPVLSAVESVCFAGARDPASVAAALEQVAALPRPRVGASAGPT